MYSLWWDFEDYCCLMERIRILFLTDGEQKWEKGGIQKRWPSPHLPKRPRQRVSWLAWTFKHFKIPQPIYQNIQEGLCCIQTVSSWHWHWSNYLPGPKVSNLIGGAGGGSTLRTDSVKGFLSPSLKRFLIPSLKRFLTPSLKCSIFRKPKDFWLNPHALDDWEVKYWHVRWFVEQIILHWNVCCFIFGPKLLQSFHIMEQFS